MPCKRGVVTRRSVPPLGVCGARKLKGFEGTGIPFLAVFALRFCTYHKLQRVTTNQEIKAHFHKSRKRLLKEPNDTPNSRNTLEVQTEEFKRLLFKFMVIILLALGVASHRCGRSILPQ